MPKLFLHVGLPKTATTSIQSFLAKNDEALARKGWLYPKAARQHEAHHVIGGFFRQDHVNWIQRSDPVETKKALLKEVDESGCENVIMSTESLASVPRTAEKMEQIKEYFSDFEVHPVFYLRRQDLLFEALLRDNMKIQAKSCRKVAYFERNKSWLDHYEWLSLWGKAYGNDRLRVSVFSKGGGRVEVERMFAEKIGLEFDPAFKITPPQNTTLSRDSLAYIMRCFDLKRISPKFWTFEKILGSYSKKNPDPAKHKFIWSPQERLEMLESCAASNAKVAKEFCGIESGILFNDPLPSLDDPWEEYAGLSYQKLAEIGFFVSSQLYAQNKALRAQI